MSTAQTGGGAATHSGTDYQNRVAAWAAVRILAEQKSTPPFDLDSSTTLEFLRCETPEPVDDLLIGTSTCGHLFLQAKHSMTLDAAAGSEFAGVVDQFVRQFHAHPAVNQQPSWHRPLDATLDRLILATSSHASKPVRHVLPAILNRIRALSPNQLIDEAANSEEERKVLTVLKDHVGRSWKALRGADPTPAEICRLAFLMRVQTLDVDAGEAQEYEAKDVLRRSILKSPNDADLAWSKLVSTCATFAANRTGATRSELQHVTEPSVPAANLTWDATRNQPAPFLVWSTLTLVMPPSY
jgi:hypothetical protein